MRKSRNLGSRVIDEALLTAFREKKQCEWCRKPGLVQPHHVHGKGFGSWRRMDLAINLISLCVECHTAVHAGQILRCDLLAVVAAREKTTQDAIEIEIYRRRRL